jgi:mediator of replication checkpoint protein 1
LDDSDDELAAPPASVKPDKRDAFREMARRRKEALTAAERLDVEKEMRGMMEEQAEESEDEYAGLGGDDYVAPETEHDREMIDSSHIDVDGRALAAHFAERQRLRDEEETSKLYKDLTTGVLRRKMGANAFDLDEDEDEIAARRRQMRQQEEARKRRALLKDENIATLAEGKHSKGKDAFLKAIADDDGDDEMVGLSDEEVEIAPATQDDSSQPQSQREHSPALLREISANKRKFSDGEDATEDRAPAKLRRTQASAFKRPTSLLEVKESVSFLLDEPDAGPAFGPTALELSSDSENEGQQDEIDESDGDDEVTTEAARQNDGGYAPNPASMGAKSMPPPRLPASQRRTAPKPAVVDRLTLKRGSSASDSSSTGHNRTAWAAGPTTGGFKVPSLLRRATTNSTTSSNDRGVTTPVLSRENSGVKMGGTKKSSLAYQARAEERKAIVEASAKRRQENTAKIAAMRRTSSGLGRGLTGRFE